MASVKRARGRSPARRPRSARGKGAQRASPKGRYWSAQVTQHSDALDLEQGVFKRGDARSIARSLKRSADQSRRRKAAPFQSAMSMLNFYINRAGKGLPAAQRSRLQAVKSQLRALYGRSQG
jgi:hypothetical protein